MNYVFLLKIILTPTLIAVASLSGRRWGPSVSGWLVGLPLTSGPIIIFITISQGSVFAKSAAMGTILGTISQAFVCLAYAWLSKRWSWSATLAASIVVFTASTVLFQNIYLPLLQLYILTIIILSILLIMMPKNKKKEQLKAALPRWDIPLRMVLVTFYVLVLTAIAAYLGPHLTGLLSPFPLYGLVLSTFGHKFGGASDAIRVMRGLVGGLYCFVSFFFIYALTIERMVFYKSLLLALAAVIIIQGIMLWMIRKEWI